MKVFNVATGEVREFDDQTVAKYAVAMCFCDEDRRLSTRFHSAAWGNTLGEFYLSLPISEAGTVIACGDWVVSTRDLRPIQVGDRVRSYDFEGRKDCYAEGVVQGIGFRDVFRDCEHYEILVTKIVWAGEEETPEPDHKVYPPVNGIPKTTGGKTNGVKRI